jgi:hypothetical protein
MVGEEHLRTGLDCLEQKRRAGVEARGPSYLGLWAKAGATLALYGASPTSTSSRAWQMSFGRIFEKTSKHFSTRINTYKKEGWITDFKAFLNDTVERPGDWDVAIAVLYPNYAAFDQLDAKAGALVTKHYGSHEARWKRQRSARSRGKSLPAISPAK